jgi:hypothetical protein
MAAPTLDYARLTLAETPSKTAEMIWARGGQGVREANSGISKGNLATIHAVIWGQCSEAMKAKGKVTQRLQGQMPPTTTVFGSLRQIKAVTLQFDEKRNGFISLLDARTSFLTCRQSQGQTADEYLERLKGWADTIEYHGGTVAETHELVPSEMDDGTNTQRHGAKSDCARPHTCHCPDSEVPTQPGMEHSSPTYQTNTQWETMIIRQTSPLPIVYL